MKSLLVRAATAFSMFSFVLALAGCPPKDDVIPLPKWPAPAGGQIPLPRPCEMDRTC
jgi:hypothetical protein